MPTLDDSSTFWSDQLAASMAMLAAYNAAILALVSGNVQSYTLNTGQTQQTVTKFNLASLRMTREALMNEIATLDARVNGGGTHVVPNF